MKERERENYRMLDEAGAEKAKLERQRPSQTCSCGGGSHQGPATRLEDKSLQR